MAEPDGDLEHPEPGGTSLVSLPGVKELLTSRRETDARTAMTRGLKEYLEQLAIDWPGGRQSRFVKVFQTWAEPEVPAEFPTAVVYGPGSGAYEAHDFAPRTIDLGNRRALRKVAEFMLPITVDVWATDPAERMALVAMLEDAFDPVDWMTGFLLELPHYHGVRASFEKVSGTYEDDPDASHRRWRRATFVLNGNVPQLRFVGEVPPFRPRFDLEDQGAIGDGVVV